MIEIKLDDCNGNVNKMLSKFKKKVRESKIIVEMKERERYTSKKEKKKAKTKKALHKRKTKESEDRDFNSKI